MLPEHALVVGTGSVEQLEQASGAPALVGRARILLLELQAHAVAVGEVLHRADELETLGVHDEVEGVAGGLAAEAVIDLARGADTERWRALVVEGTQPDVGVGTRAAQLRPRAHQVHHVDGITDPLLGVRGVASHQSPNARGTASSSKARMQ